MSKKYITSDCEGMMFLVEWRTKEWILHREDGPALKRYYSSGKKYKQEWRYNGMLHRIGKPAKVVWHDNGQIWYICYYKDGKPFREDGPTEVRWWSNDQKCQEIYCDIHGCLHREDGPANKEWRYNGTLSKIEYHIHGVKQEPLTKRAL